jgi:hypothetical protein
VDQNPVWVIPALLALAAVGGAVGWSALTSGPATPTSSELDAARRAATAQNIQAQITLDRLAPVLTAAIPLMIAGGAFLLWKSRQNPEE